MSQRKVGSVTYQEVGEEYFKNRGLRRHAGVWSLWALGVGAVISGEFYGWNFGLGTGGFVGLAIAGVLMAIMYYGLVYSIAEMSPALPHTGGAYSFARSAIPCLCWYTGSSGLHPLAFSRSCFRLQCTLVARWQAGLDSTSSRTRSFVSL